MFLLNAHQQQLEKALPCLGFPASLLIGPAYLTLCCKQRRRAGGRIPRGDVLSFIKGLQRQGPLNSFCELTSEAA
jgi:hypothetical protein